MSRYQKALYFLKIPALLDSHQKKYRTNSVLIGENYNVNFGEIRQNRPSEIRLSGVRPPTTINKNSKNIERTLF